VVWAPGAGPRSDRGRPAGERFFVYLLRFAFDAQPQHDRRVEVGLDNASMPKAKMYYSSFAEAGAPWSVASNSARELLGEKADAAEVSEDPAAWTRDEGARTLRVVFER
jgi:hypothetical protein